jgi:hypothetical protein
LSAGEQTIDWALTASNCRSTRSGPSGTPERFTWWADQNAQTVEILGEETGPEGETGYLIGVRTDILRDLDLTEAASTELNDGPMRFAAMAGPVYDREQPDAEPSLAGPGSRGQRRMDGRGARLGGGHGRSPRRGCSGPTPADALGAQPAQHRSPAAGPRPDPDEMVYAVENVFVEQGKGPCSMAGAGVHRHQVDRYMMQPPSIGASGGGQCFVVEFPFGTSLRRCVMAMGTQARPHVRANGLSVLQRFPFQAAATPAEGIELRAHPQRCRAHRQRHRVRVRQLRPRQRHPVLHRGSSPTRCIARSRCRTSPSPVRQGLWRCRCGCSTSSGRRSRFPCERSSLGRAMLREAEGQPRQSG